ncbi:MFS transporter small subunit [Kineococcus gypseus]|uniref:MFS transporter small subunit n=1 Tax=Kineococcus gypseus TaxID=1637102 RepID=UPI003D7D5D52
MSTAAQHGPAAGGSRGAGGGTAGAPARSSTGRVAFGWTLVGVPLVYGVVETLVRVSRLFTG